MLGSWLVWLSVGVVGTGLVSVVATKGGQKWLKKQRAKLRKKAVRDSREAIRALRKDTPKRRAKAEQRAQRKAQPHRLTFGHKPPPGEQTLARRAAAKAKGADGWRTVGARARDTAGSTIDRMRVARMNRKASRARHNMGLVEILTLDADVQRAQSRGLCGSTDTDDGHPCKNLRMVGQRRCQLHGGTDSIA